MLNTSKERKTYLYIVGGKIAKKVEPDTVGAVKRFSEKSKKDVHELIYDSIDGVITKAEITKNEFGQYLEITLVDGAESCILSMPTESKYFDSFCSKIGTVGVGKKINVRPYSFTAKDDGKKKTGISITVNGTKVDYYFTKENPRGKPMFGETKLSDVEYKIFKLKEREFFCKYIQSLATTVQGSVDNGAPSDFSADDFAKEDGEEVPF